MCRSRPIAGLLAGILALAGGGGCAYSMIAGGQVREPAFQAVLDRTVEVRRIEPAGRPAVEVATPESLVAVLEWAIDQQWTEEALDRYERSLVAVGLWPPGHRLRDDMVSLWSGEVAGLYVPMTGRIYVVEDVPVPFSIRLVSFLSQRDLLAELVVSHELVHWLQHGAHPELLDPSGHRLDQDDLDLALQAALEGDALRYGYQAMGLDPSALSDEAIEAAAAAEVAERLDASPDEVPAVLSQTLVYPYAKGLPLSLGEGPDLLERPPASTEQVLHPERRREAFQAFDLRALGEALPPGCSFLYENTVGELLLSVLFRDLGGDVPATVWEGWDGDRYLAADCDGALELLWLSAWDSPRDAAEFAAVYAEIAPALSARAGHASPPRVSRDGDEVVVWTEGLEALAEELPSLASRRRVSEAAELREP